MSVLLVAEQECLSQPEGCLLAIGMRTIEPTHGSAPKSNYTRDYSTEISTSGPLAAAKPGTGRSHSFRLDSPFHVICSAQNRDVQAEQEGLAPDRVV